MHAEHHEASRRSPYQVPGVHPHQPPAYSMTYPPPMMAGHPNASGSLHTVHAVLSLLTLGLWLPVWVVYAIVIQRGAPTRVSGGQPQEL